MCEGEKENGRVRGRREERQRQGKDIILKLSLLNVGWEGGRQREREREGSVSAVSPNSSQPQLSVDFYKWQVVRGG